jgi:uncharacterized protein (TIGR03437 family)
VVNDTPSGNSDSPSGLAANTTYFWEVHGRSSAEYGTWSSVYSFKTAAAGNFTVTASPGSQTVTQGNSTSYTVTVQSQNGFSSGVALTILSLPGNQVLAGTGFSPQTVTPSANGSAQSTLTIATNTATPTGTFSMTVQGVSGSITQTYGISITVNAAATQLPAPTLSSPSNGATSVALPVTLSWSSVSGATSGYRVLIATTAAALPSDPTASTCSCVVNDTPSGNSDSPSGLAANTTYFWEVHGRSSAEYGTWSSVYSFKTAAAAGADFTVTASPGSQTVTQGNSTSYTVTVQSQSGFSGPVSLSVLNLPGNQVLAGTGFSPSTVTPSANGSVQSTLSIVTNSSTPTGTFSMTVQGANGGTTHTASVSVTVNASATQLPAPTLISPSNGAVSVGLPVTLSWSSVSAANAGYRVLIATSASALPSDPTTGACGGCVVNDAPSGASDSPSGLLAGTTYYWEVHGRSSAEYGTWSSVYSFKTAAAGDFTVTASPGSQTVTQGNSASYTVTVQSQSGFSGPVSLSVLNLPGNQVLAGTGLSPSTVTPFANGSVQSTLTIVTNSATPTGMFSMTVQGVSGSITHTYGISITVNAAATQLPSPTLLSPSVGASGVTTPVTFSWTAVAGATSGYRLLVASSLSSLPTDPTVDTCSCVVNDTPLGTSDTPSILLPGTTYYWEVHGRSTTQYGTWSSINSFTTGGSAGFSISASPGSQTVTQGQTTTYTVTVQSQSGFSGPVSLSVLNLPGNQVLAGTGFSPSTVTPSASGSAQSTLSIVTSSSTPTGTFLMTVQGTNGGTAHTVSTWITVSASATQLPSPTLLSPSLGSTGIAIPVTLGWTAVTGASSGYRVLVAASPSSLPTDPTVDTCSCVVNDAPLGTSDTPSGLLPGTTYYWEVHGRSSAEYGTWSNINTFTTASSASFSISASPGSQTVTQGQMTAYTVTVQSQSGFSGPVSLSVLNLPGNQVLAGTGFSPSTVTPSANGSAQSTLSIVTNSSTPTGTFSMTVQGTNGGTTHTTGISITVSPSSAPDFSISASPTSQTVTQGQNLTYSVIVSSSNSFNAAVSLSVVNLPGNQVLAGTGFSPSTVMPSGNASAQSTLTIVTNSATPTGTFSMTVQATNSLTTHTAGIMITVTPGSVPDFSVSASPIAQTLTQGQSTSYAVNIGSVNAFKSAVSLSVLNLPGNLVLPGTQFSPQTVTPPANGSVQSTLTIMTNSSTPTGTFSTTVQGTSGGITRTFGISISVTHATQITSILPPNLNASTTPQAVSLTGSGLASAASVIFTPPGSLSKQSVSPTSVQTNQVSALVTLNAAGTWTFQVLNQDGSSSNTLNVPVASAIGTTGALLISSNLPTSTFQISPAIPGAPTSGPYPVSVPASVGDYTVTFQPSVGYTAPDPQTSTIRAGVNTVFTGNYIPIASAVLLSDTAALTFSYSSPGSAASQSRSVNIRSTGVALSFTVSTSVKQGSGWLAANLQSGTTPRILTVTVSGGLSPGIYTGSVTITPTGGTSPSLVLPVLLTTTSLDFIDPAQFLTSQTTVGPIVPDPDFINPSHAPTVDGLAADGVTRLLLRFRASEPGTFSLTLTDASGNLLPQPQYGELFDTSIHTALLGNAQYAFTVLRSPSVLPTGWTSSSAAQVSYTFRADSDGTVSTGSRPVLLVRPPVILVHGLWDSASGWTSNWGPLPPGTVGCPSSAPVLSQPFVCRADYQAVNSDKLAQIAPVLASQVSQYISQFTAVLHVAAIQADVIAHSLGGLAVRTMPQCGFAFQDCQVDYFSAATYGKGMVHRLITISTPHSGTGIATIITANRNNSCAGGFTPSDIFDWFNHPIGGALEDMALGSGALSAISSGFVPFPIYFYSGVASDSDHTAFAGYTNTTLDEVSVGDVETEGLLGAVEAAQCGSLQSALDEFNKLPSDLLVPVASALNELPQNGPGTEIGSPSMIHSSAIALGPAHYSEEERADPDLPSRLFDTLMADEGQFWKPQDASALPIWTAASRRPSRRLTSSGVGVQTTQPHATAQGSGDFSITAPPAGAVVSPGAKLQITLEASPGIQIVAADVISPAGALHFGTPSGGIVLPIPADRQGPFTFSVVGTSQSGAQTSQVRSIVVESPAAIQRIVVGPTTLRLYADYTTQDQKPDVGGLRVTGVFSDGTRDITLSSLTTYSVQNGLVAKVDPVGNVTAVAPGQTAIVASYGSVQGSAVVQVNISDLHGDLNGDGVIDGFDYSLLAQAVGQAVTGPDDPRDLNGDGVIDAKDLTALSALCPSALCNASGGHLTLVNAGSLVPGDLAPGEIVSLGGEDISNATASAPGLPLPTSLAGLEVLINNVPAPLFYVASGQIKFQVPFGLGLGSGSLAISISGVAVVSQAVNIVAAAPGILAAGGRCAIQNDDYTLNAASNGAAAGSYVVVYFTGEGQVDVQVPSGSPAPLQPLARTVSETAVNIGGVASNVMFSGLTPGFVGLAQANVQVPNLPPGDYPISITIAGSVSNAGTITVK